MTVEARLRSNLLTLAVAYSEHKGISTSGLGRQISNTSQFFDRIEDTSKSFNVRTYDETVRWFSNHWPDDLPWPPGIPRPAPQAANDPAPANPSKEKTRGKG